MILAGVRLYVPAVVLNLILKTSSKAGKAARRPKSTARADVDAADDDQIEDDDDADELTGASVVDDNDDDDIDFDDDDDVDVDDDGPGIIQDDISDDDELLPNLDDKDEN